MANLTTMPLPLNAGPKPFIKASGVAATDSLVINAVPNTTGASTVAPPTTIGGTNPSTIEGKVVYGIFNFQSSKTITTLAELRDSAELKLSFDGISDLDWKPGTFKVAALDANGKIYSDIPSNYDDPGFTAVANSYETDGWAKVNFADKYATSGMLYLKDGSPLNPFSGTGVYGLVLSVEIFNDALVESGEFVKFKIEQGMASGTAFTESNYTEATIGIKDNVGGSTNTGFYTGTGYATMNLSTATLSGLSDGATAGKFGTDDKVDHFILQQGLTLTSTGSVPAGEYNKSGWSVSGTSFTDLYNFDREDVLTINFKTFKPGLSLTTVDAVSAGIANEAYLINTLLALEGYTINNSGIYLFEVANSSTANGNVANPGTGVSTYVYIDTNQDGKVNTNGMGDALVRLSGVSVADVMSTNFNLIL